MNLTIDPRRTHFFCGRQRSVRVNLNAIGGMACVETFWCFKTTNDLVKLNRAVMFSDEVVHLQNYDLLQIFGNLLPKH